ncbi:Na(+)/H(+) exchanger protein 7-like [Daphnia pulex]|uniref:Na(+)/H(+) exchanger protein 7-like n=1 Tax=Daphnia pulex TaxID=6669 RepID=UPI001EDDF953|nr:Na(+)/H(+) exchanger protein 7-like [Daphnia pulex]XP_046442646.1 Na(+)/H(+) exchanger protein 7-like [Daphnia pulex]
MAILFLLFLLHSTLTSSAQLTNNQSDFYSSADTKHTDVRIFPVLEHNRSVVNELADQKTLSAAHDTHGEEVEHHHHGIHVASWRWDEIGIYITFTTFIIVAGLAKVAFHHAHVISSRIPESCLLILLGTAVGGILYASGIQRSGPTSLNAEEAFVFPTFTPKLFFFILLPPIILEASYSLYDRAFADNTGTVLFYAVIGTIFNTFVIGLSLLGLVSIGWIGNVHIPEGTGVELSAPSYTLQTTDCLVFSALISAVDPVAVLAIFQEIGINKDLYFLVFGESLLNDAVTVVLYSMMVVFAQMDGNIGGEQYLLGFVSFFTISLGGFGIGILCGLLTALITRTTSEVRVVEPLAVLGMAYFSYMGAELFHFSGIISCIGCGLVQAHYSFSNISRKSFTTVKYFIKMLSSTSDCIIFLFLGMVLVNDVHEWHTGFVLWTLFLCLAVRFIGVFILTAIANRFRIKQVSLREQFIMAYGGLRGAVSFSLVEMLLPSDIQPRQMFVTTTLVVILFTVFIQGGTIKLFVRLLDIKKDSQSVQYLINEINETMFDHLCAGFEGICDQHGNNFLREKIERFDENYLRPIFTLSTEKDPLQRLFEKLTLSEHAANMYDIRAKTSEPASTSTSLTDIDESHLISELATADPTSSVPSSNDARNSPAFHRQSQLLGHGKQQEKMQGKSFVDVVAMLRHQRSAHSEGVMPTHAPAAQLVRSTPLDPEATAQAFRKALRTNSSMNQSKRLHEKRNLIKDDDLPEPSRWMALRRRISTVPDSASQGDRFAQAVLSAMSSQLPGGGFAPAVGSPLGSVKKGSRLHQSAKCSTESEWSITRGSSKQSKLVNPSGSTVPLRVIAERTGEQSTVQQSISLHMQDIEKDDEQPESYHASETGL